MEITKIIETETGHRLTDYDGKCAHLHGHRYRWEVTVTAPKLDSTGFILDYSELKQILENTIGELDHAFLFHRTDPLIVCARDDPALLRATNGDRGRVFNLGFNPTSENIVGWMANVLNKNLRSTTGMAKIQLTHIRLWETSTSFCDWHSEKL